MSTLVALTETLHDAARAAGAVLLEYYRRPDLAVELKGAADLVTSADHAAEALILSRIRDAYPTHGVLAEESGLSSGEAQVCWYVDPLDGTLNYASQIPFWCTSLAVEAGAEGRAGAVYAPLLDEYFAAVSGQGVTLNGVPVTPRRVPPGDALIYTHLGHGDSHLAASLAVTAALAPRVRRLRMMGSVAMALSYVAAGRMDGVVQLGVSAWDFMAGVLMVEESGGVVTDPLGGPLRPDSRGVVAAATPALLQLLLDGIASVRAAE